MRRNPRRNGITLLSGLLKGESGQALVLGAVCMVVLIGILGLAVDVGQLRFQKRQLQTLADAAVLAAAAELNHCGSSNDCGTMQTAAQKALVENGATVATVLTQCVGTASGLTLEINNGPCAVASDPNNGNAAYVEAVVSKSQVMPFSSILGVSPMTVSARAEARLGNSPFCIFTQQATLNSGSQTSASCGLVIDGCLASNNMNGVHVTVTVFDIYCPGGKAPKGNSLNPAPTMISAPVIDPLSWVTTNNTWTLPACYNNCNNVSVNSNLSLTAGLTYGGINVNSGTLTLNPGTYYFTGNLIVNSGANLQSTTCTSSGCTGSSGVTLYFTNGATMITNSGSQAYLSAPTPCSNSTAGILIYQDPSDTAEMILDSGSTSIFQGAIYIPKGSLDFDSGGKATAYTIVDVNTLYINSGGQLNDDYSSLPCGSPAKSSSGFLAE